MLPSSSATLHADRVARFSKDVRSHRLTTVVAPAGWGKSTLLSRWREGGTVDAAWVDVDGIDGPTAFWSAVTAACSRYPDAEARRQVLGTTHPPEALGREMAHAPWPGELVVVVDDFHRLASHDLHASLLAFLERAPSGIHVVAASRRLVPVATARLRASGQLSEFGIDDLRLDEAESERTLIEASGAQLSAGQARGACRLLAGWPAAIQLAGRSARATASPASTTSTWELRGDDRWIANYIEAEVLAPLNRDARQFLADTAVCDRLCGDLADAITGRTDGATTLVELHQTHALFEPLDNRGHWYRLHPLLRDAALLGKQQPVEDTSVRDRHRRAGRWLLDNGLTRAAVGHVINAGDFDTGADLIVKHYWETISAGGTGVVLGWLERLPPSTVNDDARLLLAKASALLLCGRTSEVSAVLDTAERSGTPSRPFLDGIASVDAGVAIGRAAVAMRRGDVVESASAAATARSLHKEGHTYQLANAEILLAGVATRDGRPDLARKWMNNALDRGRDADNVLAVLASLCGLATGHATLGELATASRLLREADLVLQRRAPGSAFARHIVATSRATFQHRSGALEQARTSFEQVLSMCTVAHDRAGALEAAMALAEIEVQLESPTSAEAWLQEAERSYDACRHPGRAVDERITYVRRAVTAMRRSDDRPVLTHRQAVVLGLVRDGLTNAEIAVRLGISARTVHAHLRDTYRRLGATSRSQAVELFERFAIP